MAAFIVFEGIDGSGKSTQARALYRRLVSREFLSILTHEPGGTPLGEALRRWVKRRQGLYPLTELYLFNAARAQLVEQVIRPALQKGVTVLADRYFASTIAYQSYGRGLDLELVHHANHGATGGLSPDLTVFLDVSPEVGRGRKGGRARDNFDAAPVEFYRKVRQGYLEQADQAKKRGPEWLVLDGSRARAQLAEEIWAKVQPLL
ncbi:MAG: dTMP kinase [SAR202 cluster bacterium Io17-Chloro-G9]|nr:MAG: dTMP kinase [SAR202 cluster bacterium Io17-Chloro-G9]